MRIDTREFAVTARLHPLGPPETGFAENTAAAWRAMRFNNRFVSERRNLTAAYDAYLDDVRAATGRRFENPEGAQPAGAGLGQAQIEDPLGLGIAERTKATAGAICEQRETTP